VTRRAGHATRSKLEAAVCEEMVRQRLPHEHRSLRFRVHDAAGAAARYSPAIVVRRGPILFLVEPIAAMTRPTIERFSGFLVQHSPEIVLVLVTPDAQVRKAPPETYDEIYPESELARMTRRIREQDPDGLVAPFEKPRPAG
jgi:hypothetical protein